ncbi:phosphotransferase [Streptomyces sp. NPDC058256]|uniref:phosphotransferase n=1 Tax=Streptomyces sp. NPDC058256 TaxID=3346408 RepID=UPI0036E87429
MTVAYFTKNYRDPSQVAAAARHYYWLAAHAQPFRQPSLTVVGPTSLTFERIEGRCAEPGDLPRLAGLLGEAHGAAWVSDLHRTSVDMAHSFRDGTLFGDYYRPREVALRKRLRFGYLPNKVALHAMLTLLGKTAEGPAAFYKDSNPRNFVIADDGAVFIVDTDDLTLAPFAYDLAKLIATLIMTHGPLHDGAADGALATYNQAAARYDARLGTTDRERLDGFLVLHSVLTAPYIGCHGYRYGWSGLTRQLQEPS